MRLDDLLADMLRRQAETERRLANLHRHGRVEQVDAKAGKVRLRIGGTDDQPMLSPWIPYAQVAGALKIHSPPSVGQQMTLVSPTGDYRQGYAIPLTWSDSNPAPNDRDSEHTLTLGSVRIDLTDAGLKLTIGGFSLDLTASGATYTVDGVTHTITGAGVETTGGQVKHDGRSIGSDHRHGGVMPGAADTDVPKA